MAPEVLARLPYGSGCDIWSLGATVVEMLTGNPPFVHLVRSAKDNNPRAAARLIVNHLAQGGSPKLPSGVSPACLSFLRACFTPSPLTRPTAVQLLSHPWLEGVRDDDTAEREDDEDDDEGNLVLDAPAWKADGFRAAAEAASAAAAALAANRARAAAAAAAQASAAAGSSSGSASGGSGSTGTNAGGSAAPGELPGADRSAAISVTVAENAGACAGAGAPAGQSVACDSVIDNAPIPVPEPQSAGATPPPLVVDLILETV